MDCVSEDECAAGTDGGLARVLVFAGSFGEGLFLFYSDIAKLCRVKDFPAFLTLNKFCVFLSGDDLDDGMFALGCHLGEEIANGMDFARLRRPCQLGFVRVFLVKIVVKLW
jgi:hypothetical protein